MLFKFISIITIVLLQASFVFAFNVDGKYTYKEGGCTGHMDVIENDYGMDPHIIVKISTACTEQAHTCEYEVKGVRVISTADAISTQFESIPDEYTKDLDPAKFSIDFTKYGATIKISERGPYCGLNGYYGGKWTKDGVKQPAEKNRAKEATQICSEYIRIKKECYYKAKKGVFPDKAISSLKKTKIPEEVRDAACRDGFAAYGRAGDIKEGILKKALQQDFTQCYNELTKE